MSISIFLFWGFRLLRVTLKENLRLIKNSPCGGVGEGDYIFVDGKNGQLKSNKKLPALSFLSAQFKK